MLNGKVVADRSHKWIYKEPNDQEINFLFVLTFALRAGPVQGLLQTEIFPSRIRAKAMAFCMSVHWINLQLMVTCFLLSNQAYSANHILKGTQMAQSRYLFALSCFHMNLLTEAEAALCPRNDPASEVPNGAAGHYLLGLVYRFLYGDQARFFNDEIHIDLKHSKTGTVAMASAGENMNASQFYITLRDDLDYLDGKHTVFGEVAEGFETLTRINEAFADGKGRPFKNIRIKHTYILEDPFDDPPQLPEFIPEGSPEGKPKDEVDDEVRLEDDWVPMDEQLNPGELEEVIRSKEAHSRAVVLESIGDIPDAEVKPPDNVLFVCKLNPVTEDEDLHTIFSRFGTVSSAEIIRDHKTGDSLCYAFIEFEDKQACEQAYFKMDNALIDDRRIHVDFSQSVAKLWSQYMRKDNKGGGCFKCGSTDHIARDCTGDATMKQSSKYILKDNNSQRGGHNARYEMVFDGDNTESPRHETKHQRHDRDERDDKVGRRENFKERSHRGHSDQEMAGSNNRDRYANRSRGLEGNGDDKARLERSARGSDSFAGKKDRERQMGRQRDDDYRRKDELDSRKRDLGDSYTESRASRDDRRKTDGSHSDKRYDRDYRKRTEDSERQDVKIDSGRRKRSPDVDDYKRRRNDEDCREDLKIDSRRRKQSPDNGDYKHGGDHEDYKHRREDRGNRRHDTDRRHHGDKR